MQARPNIPIIKGSTARILTGLYQTLKAPTIAGVEAIPPSNPILRQCVALDCMTAMESSKISRKSPLNNVIDYMEANIPRLPQADIKKILGAQLTDIKGKLSDHQTSVNALIEKIHEIMSKQDKSIDNILRMVAAQPDSMTGSQPIEQQLQRERNTLLELRKNIENIQRQEQTLRGSIQLTFDTLKRSSGEREMSITRLIDDQYAPPTPGAS